jgi:hypothetical protein
MSTDTVKHLQDNMDESWKGPHQRVMECRNLEVLIRRGLTIYRAIQTLDTHYSNTVRAGLVKWDSEAAKQIEVLYVQWLGPCPYVFQQIEEMEASGLEVDGAKDLRLAYNNCPARGFDVASTEKAAQQVAKGEAVSKDDALNGLRRRIFAPGS